MLLPSPSWARGPIRARLRLLVVARQPGRVLYHGYLRQPYQWQGATVNLTGTLDNSEDDNPQSRGTLALDDSTGPLSLDGGTILQGEITTDGPDDLVATLQGGKLDGVTLDGTLDMTQFAGSFTPTKFSGSSVTVLNGLTLDGTIELGGASGTSNAGDLLFGSADDNVAQTISGSGTIQFGQDNAGDVLFDASNEPLTFGPNLTVQIGLHSYIESPKAAIVNQGTIANASGGTLTMQADLTNAGTLDPGTGMVTVTNYTQTSRAFSTLKSAARANTASWQSAAT